MFATLVINGVFMSVASGLMFAFRAKRPVDQSEADR